MQFVITIVVGEAEDVFEVAQLLQPIAKLDKLKMVSVVPRPQGVVHQPLAEGQTTGKLPGAPQGSPGHAVQGGIAPTFSISPQPKPAAKPAEPAAPSG
jgi:hypothetical protein